MAKRTEEMKAYENTKGDLEEQLRRDCRAPKARRQHVYRRRKDYVF